MSAPRRTNQSDPTAERTADQSTQTNSGLSEVRRGVRVEPGEDVFNRNQEIRYATPRRYEKDDDTLTGDDDRG